MVCGNIPSTEVLHKHLEVCIEEQMAEPARQLGVVIIVETSTISQHIDNLQATWSMNIRERNAEQWVYKIFNLYHPCYFYGSLYV